MPNFSDIRYQVDGEIPLNPKEWLAFPNEVYYRDLDGNRRRLVIYSVRVKSLSTQAIELIGLTDESNGPHRAPTKYELILRFERHKGKWTLQVQGQRSVSVAPKRWEALRRILYIWRMMLTVAVLYVCVFFLFRILSVEDVWRGTYIIGWCLALPHLVAWYFADATEQPTREYLKFGLCGLAMIGASIFLWTAK